MEIGQEFSTLDGRKFIAIELLPKSMVKVRFITTGTEVITTKGHAKSGKVNDPYNPSVKGLGYLGLGHYNSKSNFYGTWVRMFHRVYSHNPTHKYLSISIVEPWHNFQTFAKWAEETCPNLEYELDKDLKKSLIYGPQFCVWLPKDLNKLLVPSRAKSSELPIGVNKSGKKFTANCSNHLGIREHLGTFPSIEEAYTAYKTAKSLAIKNKAEDYFSRGLIDATTKELFFNYIVS